MEEMRACRRFARCSAPLCPLDPGMEYRVWYAGEPVCKSPAHTRRQWIRKQRRVIRKFRVSWFFRPVTVSELIAAAGYRQLRLPEPTEPERMNP